MKKGLFLLAATIIGAVYVIGLGIYCGKELNFIAGVILSLVSLFLEYCTLAEEFYLLTVELTAEQIFFGCKPLEKVKVDEFLKPIRRLFWTGIEVSALKLLALVLYGFSSTTVAVYFVVTGCLLMFHSYSLDQIGSDIDDFFE